MIMIMKIKVKMKKNGKKEKKIVEKKKIMKEKAAAITTGPAAADTLKTGREPLLFIERDAYPRRICNRSTGNGSLAPQIRHRRALLSF